MLYPILIPDSILVLWTGFFFFFFGLPTVCFTRLFSFSTVFFFFRRNSSKLRFINRNGGPLQISLCWLQVVILVISKHLKEIIMM